MSTEKIHYLLLFDVIAYTYFCTKELKRPFIYMVQSCMFATLITLICTRKTCRCREKYCIKYYLKLLLLFKI